MIVPPNIPNLKPGKEKRGDSRSKGRRGRKSPASGRSTTFTPGVERGGFRGRRGPRSPPLRPASAALSVELFCTRSLWDQVCSAAPRLLTWSRSASVEEAEPPSHRMCSSIPGLYSPDASSTLLPLLPPECLQTTCLRWWKPHPKHSNCPESSLVLGPEAGTQAGTLMLPRAWQGTEKSIPKSGSVHASSVCPQPGGSPRASAGAPRPKPGGSPRVACSCSVRSSTVCMC